MDKTLILVDYDNVFVTLVNNYRDFNNPNIMYEVISKIKEQYKHDNILSYILFADFQRVQISDEGYDILRKNHVEVEHVFNGKNASDIILMINCMKYMMQYPHINKIVLVSSDSDLVPIFHEVQLLDKKLEVLYFDLNTSDEHIKHMQTTNISHSSIENLLGIKKYEPYSTLEDFYNSKITDIEGFTKLLQKINDIILEAYKKYFKQDSDGHITNVGIIRLGDLVEQMKKQGLCPEREFKKSASDVYENIIDMLQDKNILEKHEYKIGGKPYNSLILSKSYLTTNSIIIKDLLEKKDFPNT